MSWNDILKNQNKRLNYSSSNTPTPKETLMEIKTLLDPLMPKIQKLVEKGHRDNLRGAEYMLSYYTTLALREVTHIYETTEDWIVEMDAIND